MGNNLFKTRLIYFLVIVLYLSFFISCKNNESKNSDENIEKQEMESCLSIKDYSGSSKIDFTNFPYPSFPGDSQISLLKNAYSFYTKYWEKELKNTGDYNKDYPGYEGVVKVREIISDPAIDIKIKTLHENNIAVINRTELGMDGYLGLEKIDDIWILKSDQWERLDGHESNSYRKARLLHLNDDEFIDAIVEGGCCDYQKLTVYIGSKDKTLSLRQIITIFGIGGLDYKGRCNSKLDIQPYEGMNEQYGTRPKLAVFDCKVNGFIVKEDKD